MVPVHYTSSLRQSQPSAGDLDAGTYPLRLARLETEGEVVEAIFFGTAVLLRSTIDFVMIVLVVGSALLVVLSKNSIAEAF